MLSNESRRSIVKIAVGIVATVFLGAVGSGLWERFLAPVADWAARRLVAGSGRLATVYLDHLYSEVGRGLHEHASMLPVAVLAVIAVVFNIGGMLAFITLRLSAGRLDSLLDTLPSPRRLIGGRLLFWLLMAVATFNSLAYSEIWFAMSYQQRTVIWLERSFEIVRPHIAEARYFELRAMYRSVDDARGFFTLWQAMNTTASEHKVTLPEFKPLGGA